MACVSDIAGDCDRCVSVGEIGSGLDVHTFHEYLGRDEELYGPKDASVVRPVTGAPARQHVFIESIVHTNGNGVCFSPMEQMRDVERECGVAFAPVFPRELAIDPNCSGVKDRLKLNPHSRILPVRSNIKGSAVPRNPVILGQWGFNLPRVRDLILAANPCLAHRRRPNVGSSQNPPNPCEKATLHRGWRDW